MSDKHPVAALAEAAKARRLVVFCGAGVSTLPPSSAPSWWEIYSAAAKALADRFREGFPDLAQHIDLPALLAPLATQQLADLIVSHFAGQTFVKLLEVVDVADPNENHAAIAALAARDLLRGAVTTNFDTLIERAAAVTGTAFAVAAPGVRVAALDPRPRLVKLHGTAVDSRQLKETSSHKAREVSPELIEAWEPMVRGSEVLVIGFSGADLNFGPVEAFFRQVVASDCRIWWLFRPAYPPTFPDWIRDRVSLISGALPDLLRELAAAADAPCSSMPVEGRDAQAALTAAMEGWSRELHIGNWSAATFLHGLAREASERSAPAKTLDTALDALGRDVASRLVAGSTFDATNLGMGIFVGQAGTLAIERGDIEAATPMLRAAVNVFESVHAQLSKAAEKPGAEDTSAAERHMNLASAWSNYAQALMLQDSARVAVPAFLRSLEHSYLGANVNSFLIALSNVLGNGFELRDARRCLRFALRGIRLADRLGAVQPSIELRLLAAFYHLDRNEVWAASVLLAEARRRAAAIGSGENVRGIRILEAQILLKRGMFAQGLEAIADAISPRSHLVFVSRPIDEARRMLDVIGVRQPGKYVFKLSRDDIPQHVARIEALINDARAAGKLPWDGAHVAVSDSSALDNAYLGALSTIGVHEFSNDVEHAVGRGLRLSQQLLNAGYFDDAAWTASNVLANPGASAEQLAVANTCLAHANAARGYVDEVDALLDAACAKFADAGESISLPTAQIGLWHAIQSGNAPAAMKWAGLAAAAAALAPNKYQVATEIARRLATWKDPFAEVHAAFLQACADAGIPLPALPPEAPQPVRFFTGRSADLDAESNRGADAVLREARKAMSGGDTQRALDTLDTLARDETPKFGDYQTGVATAIQIHALADRVPLERLDRGMDEYRKRFISNLAFSSLARLEHAMAWVALEREDMSLFTQVAEARGFVGELADDPIARAGLLALETTASRMVRPRPLSRQGRAALLSASYFGMAEGSFGNADVVNEPQKDDAKFAEQTTASYHDALKKAKSASEADVALTNAVKAFRARRLLNRTIVTRLRGDRANWSLRAAEFEDAAKQYRKLAAAFRRVGAIDDELNSIAGEARALSRSGNYSRAVDAFNIALEKAGKRPLRTNLLLGLGSAHLLEASERREPIDTALLDIAITTLRDAVNVAPVASQDSAMARLALARALGERGRATEALAQLDQATAELAHLGSPIAKALLDNRGIFVQGEWTALGLS